MHDNTRAVAHGLERTGRIVTAAALIMVAAFSGFVVGRVAGLQQLGLGLALAILLDATVDPDGARPVADGRARPLELVAAGAETVREDRRSSPPSPWDHPI